LPLNGNVDVPNIIPQTEPVVNAFEAADPIEPEVTGVTQKRARRLFSEQTVTPEPVPKPIEPSINEVETEPEAAVSATPEVEKVSDATPKLEMNPTASLERLIAQAARAGVDIAEIISGKPSDKTMSRKMLGLIPKTGEPDVGQSLDELIGKEESDTLNGAVSAEASSESQSNATEKGRQLLSISVSGDNTR
jgi:hypothetical protein